MPDTLRSATQSPTAESFTIADRFRGPPNSGNGGYVAGRVAQLLAGTDKAVEVTLRAPIPLDQPMTVSVEDSGTAASIWQGETLIVEAKVCEFEMVVPAPPSWAETRAAVAQSASLLPNVHTGVPGGTGFHPICFCCGADHNSGLKVYAAPVLGGEQVAAVWHSESQWAQADGYLPDEYLWTALDCPGQFAFLAGGITTGLLGRISAQVHHRAKAGDEYLVSGWRIAQEGKKHFAGTAIHDSDGRLLAEAKAVWIGSR